MLLLWVNPLVTFLLSIAKSVRSSLKIEWILNKPENLAQFSNTLDIHWNEYHTTIYTLKDRAITSPTYRCGSRTTSISHRRPGQLRACQFCQRAVKPVTGTSCLIKTIRLKSLSHSTLNARFNEAASI